VDNYRETNNNGAVGKSVKFSTAVAFTSAWAIPVGPGTFGGFYDRVGAKGLDGFNTQTKPESILRATYMLPVGGDKSGWKAGIGFEIWKNKFGNDASLAGATNTTGNTANQSTGLFLVEYHL
jgi:hypothetical protein